MSVSASIARNIELAKLATEAASLVIELAEESGANEPGFYDRVACILEAHGTPKREPKTKPVKMTDQQAKAFEQEIIAFGTHAGKPVSDVPLDWLQWIADQKFVDQVRLYLRSDRVQREIERLA